MAMADRERTRAGRTRRRTRRRTRTRGGGSESKPDAPRAGLADPVSPDELARMDAWYRRVIGPEAAAEMDRTMDEGERAAWISKNGSMCESICESIIESISESIHEGIRESISEGIHESIRESIEEDAQEAAQEHLREMTDHAINVDIPRMLVRAWADPHAALR